ncbi:MAG: class I SAM-dependent methyltransferase [Caldimicrobium sp.]|nr:class I SAM-dependent methyltransferase [Dictyoglomus thermophilum]MCS7200422.1 class I SAM-dependent methyltransferase [Caldimicrobium sp.]MCX7719999.1 class I SAM-dependent methyltransferase [Dictyoglomus thermophilum]MDW8094174.1 class I SAM-dependent methyltransferase [Caldimicrobium sp.]
MKFNPGKIFPPGHFYSPIPDLNEIEKRKEKIFRKRTKEEVLGLNLNDEEQLQHLKIISDSSKYWTFPEQKPSQDYKFFYLQNGLFGGLDALAYFSFVLHYRPSMIIEVGCGFSSLIAMEVNKNFFSDKINIILIEPYPSEILIEAMTYYNNVKLIKEQVQDVQIELFFQLKTNDILFVDSTHVSKVGSDVNHIFFEVLPRLNPGVLIHFHDIFIPDEYPQKWVFEENRGWNEMYILRAFLMFNNIFKILFSSYYVFTRHQDLIIKTFGKALSGGSIWIKRL